MKKNILHTFLRRHAWKERGKFLFSGILFLLAFDLPFVAGSFILDNLASLSGAVRMAFGILFILCQIAVFCIFCIRAARLFPTLRGTALNLEKTLGITDNALVNAVCFEEKKEIPEKLQKVFLSEAGNALKNKRFPAFFKDQRLRKSMKIFLSAGLPLFLYVLIFPAYAHNAFLRFVCPRTEINSINFIRFELSPGDVSIVPGAPFVISAKAYRHGERLSNIQILLRNSTGNTVPYPVVNGQCTVTLSSGDFYYAASADGEKSREYHLKVLPVPELRDFSVTLAYPDWTGKKPEKILLSNHPFLRIPEGTKMRFDCGEKELLLYGLPGKNAPCRMPAEGVFTQAADLKGVLHQGKNVFDPVWTGRIEIIKDLPPLVRFTAEKLNLEAGYGEIISVPMAFSDDYGVVSLKLTLECEKKTVLLREYRYPAPGSVKGREIFSLRITPRLLPEGSFLELRAAVSDGRGHISVTERTMTIHQADLTEKLREMTKIDPEGKCYSKLMLLLAQQTKIRDFLSERIRSKRIQRHEAVRVSDVQNRGDRLALEAGHLASEVKLPLPFRKTLSLLRTKGTLPLAEAARKFRLEPTILRANMILLDQTKLIERIRRLLGVLALYEKQKGEKKEAAKELESEKEEISSMELLKEKLDLFRKEQKKIKAETEKLDAKKAEDWTEEDEKLLGDLTAKEDEWKNFFKAKFSDLSKKHDQDFSTSSMADEFVELYEELQKAGEALKGKKIEKACLAEDSAIDSANAVSANIERWLSDKKDLIKWNSEEDGKTQDTDLTDLPAELTDIIGELVDSEEDMTDDTNDSTNSFNYDSDEALGWGSGDGTIDTMQAKGITGNSLPNNNEVGGRSGEGRSGRSSGQFAEKEATGKGGRKTPTRLQQSPYEKGTVDDKSKDGQGGATGGGKQSGVGGEGLSGVTPDRDKQTGKRLGSSEAELKQKTHAMLKRLEDSSLPTGDLREALLKLSKAEQLGSGGGVEAQNLRRSAVRFLKQAHAAVAEAVRTDREQRRRKTQRSFLPVRYPRGEKVPASYEDSVGEYFKALAVEKED